MSVCCCSLAGTAACRSCSNNPYCETPPPVRTNTIVSTDVVLITGVKTNADRIRAMTDEEIEDWYWWMHKEMMYYTDSRVFVHDWLKQEAKGEERWQQ